MHSEKVFAQKKVSPSFEFMAFQSLPSLGLEVDIGTVLSSNVIEIGFDFSRLNYTI